MLELGSCVNALSLLRKIKIIYLACVKIYEICICYKCMYCTHMALNVMNK